MSKSIKVIRPFTLVGIHQAAGSTIAVDDEIAAFHIGKGSAVLVTPKPSYPSFNNVFSGPMSPDACRDALNALGAGTAVPSLSTTFAGWTPFNPTADQIVADAPDGVSIITPTASTFRPNGIKVPSPAGAFTLNLAVERHYDVGDIGPIVGMLNSATGRFLTSFHGHDGNVRFKMIVWPSLNNIESIPHNAVVFPGKNEVRLSYQRFVKLADGTMTVEYSTDQARWVQAWSGNVNTTLGGVPDFFVLCAYSYNIPIGIKITEWDLSIG